MTMGSQRARCVAPAAMGGEEERRLGRAPPSGVAQVFGLPENQLIEPRVAAKWRSEPCLWIGGEAAPKNGHGVAFGHQQRQYLAGLAIERAESALERGLAEQARRGHGSVRHRTLDSERVAGGDAGRAGDAMADQNERRRANGWCLRRT